MKPAKRSAPGKAREWSSRSQRSWAQQFHLESEVKKTQNHISFLEKKSADATATKARQVNRAIDGDYNANKTLSIALAEIADAEGKIVVYKDHVAELKKTIRGLEHPTPAQARDRKKQQDLLAQVARERLELDCAADCFLQGLRRNLTRRSLLSQRMLELAGAIDFTVSDGFDCERFDALLTSLPAELGAASKGWLRDFFGKEATDETYIVIEASLLLPENLTSPRAYRRGDHAAVTEAEARQLVAQADAARPRTSMEMELAAQSREPGAEEREGIIQWGILPGRS